MFKFADTPSPPSRLQGDLVDLYVPRKCSATNRLITSKDHASIQITIADVDPSTGVAIKNGGTTIALCGQVRSQGESDDSINRIATKAGGEFPEPSVSEAEAEIGAHDAERRAD